MWATPSLTAIVRFLMRSCHSARESTPSCQYFFLTIDFFYPPLYPHIGKPVSYLAFSFPPSTLRSRSASSLRPNPRRRPNPGPRARPLLHQATRTRRRREGHPQFRRRTLLPPHRPRPEPAPPRQAPRRRLSLLRRRTRHSAATGGRHSRAPPHWVQVRSLLPHLLLHLISLHLLLPIHFFVSRVLDGGGGGCSQPTSVMALVPPGTSVLLPLPHLLQTFFLHLVKPLFLC